MTHLVDSVFYVNPMGTGYEKYFVLRVGDKNRQGKIGENFVIDWRHETYGAVVDSDRRWSDKTTDGWCDTHPNESSTVIDIVVRGNNKEELDRATENAIRGKISGFFKKMLC